jgi:hypothetical protein
LLEHAKRHGEGELVGLEELPGGRIPAAHNGPRFPL